MVSSLTYSLFSWLILASCLSLLIFVHSYIGYLFALILSPHTYFILSRNRISVVFAYRICLHNSVFSRFHLILYFEILFEFFFKTLLFKREKASGKNSSSNSIHHKRQIISLTHSMKNGNARAKEYFLIIIYFVMHYKHHFFLYY